LIILAGFWGSASAQVADPATAGAAATIRLLDLAASAHGILRGDASITDRFTQTLPVTGVTLEIAKIVDKATHRVVLVATDQAGRPVDVAKMEEAEETARAARYGKLNPRLAARLEGTAGVAEVPVSIWVKDSGTPPHRADMSSASAEAAEQSIQLRVAELRALSASSRQKVVDALARMGVQAEQADFSPVVFAKLTPGQIRRIANHPDVVTVYGQEQYTFFGDDASTTQRAFQVWKNGNTGRNVAARVVVHEPDGVDERNPYLNNLTHPVMYWCPRSWGSSDLCNVGKNYDNPGDGSHATRVAGVIASTHSLYQGMAPGVPLILSANSQQFTDAKLIRAAEWGIASGGAVTNMSWGTICGGFQDVQSRWVDWATKNLWHTFVISAGNHPAGCSDATNDEKVSSPGLAWSVITVGSIYDGNSGFWTGDVMSGFSDWRNPDFATSMEKPEVVAVGEAVMTTSGTGLTTAPGANGTSFAAPMVAGQVAQLVARRPGQIQWPETNKAAVLVSAYHDIEAGTTRDGVGAVVMNVSDATYANNRFVNDSNGGYPLLPAHFPRNYNNLINVAAGTKVRVAIAWDSNSNGSTTDTLGADLDLQVKRADTGATVCGSYSFSNAWEVCQFTAPVTGNYHVTVNRFSSETNWPGTFLGAAWGIASTANFCTFATALSIPGTGGSQTVTANTANGSTFFDNYPGVGWTESGRERVYRLTLTTTRKITVTDTNGSLDIGVLQIPSCTADPIVPTVKAFGMGSAVVNSAPAGTYYIVVDGYTGYVGSTTLTINVTAP
jgi:hypothetical protein